MEPDSKKVNHYVDCGGGKKGNESKYSTAAREFHEETSFIFQNIYNHSTKEETVTHTLNQLNTTQPKGISVIGYTIYLTEVPFVNEELLNESFAASIAHTVQKKRTFHWLTKQQLITIVEHQMKGKKGVAELKSLNMLPLWPRVNFPVLLEQTIPVFYTDTFFRIGYIVLVRKNAELGLFVTESTFRVMEKLQLATWCKDLKRSVLRQMIAVVSQPGILSFAGGLPAPELFPSKEFSEALQEVLATDPLALQYRPPFQPLREHIVKIMEKRGVECTSDQVFITTGSQQALDVLTRMLLNTGGDMILEEIIYTGAQQVMNPLAPKVYKVPTDLKTGIDVDKVEELLKSGIKPAFLYLVPTAHNPLGVSISHEKRIKLSELATKYEVPILEDDAYGLLVYEDDHETCLKQLNPEWVFYLGSFSKIIAPGLRIGWMIAPPSLVGTLTVIKEACDLESSGLTQRAISKFLDKGLLDSHLTKLRTEYKLRRDIMLQALTDFFPSYSTWTIPSGGMFIWVKFDIPIDTNDLLHYAIEKQKIAFIPGYAFAVPGSNISNCLRLNFSNTKPEVIREGIERLARTLIEFVAIGQTKPHQ